MIKQLLTVILGAVLVIFLLHVFDKIGSSVLYASLCAAGLASVNALAAYFLFEKSIDKPTDIYLIYNLGGMGGRLLFMLLFVFLIIYFLKIDKYAFIFIFFIFYFASLILEVVYFSRKVKKQDKTKRQNKL